MDLSDPALFLPLAAYIQVFVYVLYRNILLASGYLPLKSSYPTIENLSSKVLMFYS